MYLQSKGNHAMGREISLLKPAFLSMPSHNQKPILFAGLDHLNNPSMILEQVFDFLNTCPKLENFVFYAPTSFYKDPFWDDSFYEQRLSTLYEIRSQSQCLTATNLGDYENLENVSKVADIIIIDDYLCQMQKRVYNLMALKKPMVLDVSLLSLNQVQELAQESVQKGCPVFFYFNQPQFDNQNFYHNFFCASVFEENKINPLKAGFYLGIKGFFTPFNPLWIKKVLEIFQKNL